MGNDYVRKQTLEQERGTWREELRWCYGDWLDLPYGFRVGNGWAAIVSELLAKVDVITGGPKRCPQIRVVEVKEKLGLLRVYVRNVPPEFREAVDRAVATAEGQSLCACEVCGDAGQMVSSDGYYHVACPQHGDPTGE